MAEVEWKTRFFGRDKIKEIKDQKVERISYILNIYESLGHKNHIRGQPGWLSGLVPPSAQGVILETGIESHVRLPAWSLLLPLPVSLPLSLYLS